MSDLQIINQGTNQNRKTKQVGSNISQVVENDIWVAYNPSAPIGRMLVADNDFYKSVHNIAAKKSYSFMPYLLPNTVFNATPKRMKDISRNVIKLTPYNLLEGVAQAGKQIYTKSGVNVGQVDYRYLSQSYYLYTSLCVGISADGRISLITASMNVLKQMPILHNPTKHAEQIAQRLHPKTDDIVNGIIQCVELIPTISGYDLKPAIVNANLPDYVIAPKAWVDYLVNSINNTMTVFPCKITYLRPDGKTASVTAYNKPIKGEKQQNILCDYLKYQSPNKYGVIQCVDVQKGVITIFPITHFVSVEAIKEV